MSTTGSAQIHIADMIKGGSGAAQYMQQVAGDMNEQVAGPDGVLKYTPVSVSGGGLEQMAVPALLVLANNVAPKLVKRGGSTMKISGGKRRGRRGGGEGDEDENITENTKAELARLQITIMGDLTSWKHLAPNPKTYDNEVIEKVNQLFTEITNAQTHTEAVAVLDKFMNSLYEDDEDRSFISVDNDPTNRRYLINYMLMATSNLKRIVGPFRWRRRNIGGNMLQQAIVPATLVLASNMFGKRKMSLTPKYTKRRSNRRRLNRRKRVSRRFRRGTR